MVGIVAYSSWKSVIDGLQFRDQFINTSELTLTGPAVVDAKADEELDDCRDFLTTEDATCSTDAEAFSTNEDFGDFFAEYGTGFRFFTFLFFDGVFFDGDDILLFLVFLTGFSISLLAFGSESWITSAGTTKGLVTLLL